MDALAVLKLYETLHDKLSKVAKRAMSPSAFTNIIRQVIPPEHVQLKTVRDEVVDHNMVIIGGLYDPNDDIESDQSITLSLHFRPQQTTLMTKDLNLPFICRELCATLLHEACHQRQYRLRGYTDVVYRQSAKKYMASLTEHQSYLANPDEIEAYGVSIAADIFVRRGFTMPEKLASELKVTHDFQMYVSEFGSAHKHTKKVQHYVGVYLKEFASRWGVVSQTSK